MSSMVESIANQISDVEIHVLVRSGHGSLYTNHPNVGKVWEFDKRKKKLQNIFELGKLLKKESFNVVFNCHRYASSGLIACLTGVKTIIGFKKNPLSVFFNKSVSHELKSGWHELDRNHLLLKAFWPGLKLFPPKLYPTWLQKQKAENIMNGNDFIIIAPSSVWYTKQYPIEGWRKLIARLSSFKIILIGVKSDFETCEKIAKGFDNVASLAGQLNLLESVALIAKAQKVYACDSAPTHMASSVNVETHTVFCSTTSEFGFGPVSNNSFIHQTNEKLDCRPCGIHGKKECPLGHFKCSKFEIEV